MVLHDMLAVKKYIHYMPKPGKQEKTILELITVAELLYWSSSAVTLLDSYTITPG